MVKSPPAVQESPGFDPWVRKIPWRKGWQPTLAWRIQWTEEPGGLHSPRGCIESDMTEWLLHTHTHTHTRAHAKQSTGLHRVGHDWVTIKYTTHTHTHTHTQAKKSWSHNACLWQEIVRYCVLLCILKIIKLF